MKTINGSMNNVEVRPVRTQSPAAPGRIPALDFTKGVLVLFMVLYHWLNYFVGTVGLYYNYLRFLTPSFIFITGLLISHIYFAKYGIANPILPKRLFQRGLKLLGIFSLLNLALALVRDSPVNMVRQWSFHKLIDMYVTGNTSASFYVLVCIGYLLMAAAGLVVLGRYYKNIFHYACLLMIVLVLILAINDITAAYLRLVSIGMVGVSLGRLPDSAKSRLLRHPLLLAAAYAGYLLLITIWDVSYFMQMIGACLSVGIIYMLGKSGAKANRIPSAIIILGKYSLLGYIAQIAILQGLRLGVHINSGAIGAILMLLAGVICTYLAVRAVDLLRARMPLMDKLYSAVFA